MNKKESEKFMKERESSNVDIHINSPFYVMFVDGEWYCHFHDKSGRVFKFKVEQMDYKVASLGDKGE